jgi:hypothetical protein
MIKKVILLGDFKYLDSLPFKNAAVLRISHSLRKSGYKVKQVHHCTIFSQDELRKIITDFSDGEKVCVCVSTSFLAAGDRKNINADSNKQNMMGSAWGEKSFIFLLNIGKICKDLNFPYLVGGWEVSKKKLQNNSVYWGFPVLSKFVTCFVDGKGIDIIEKVCNDEPYKHELIGPSTLAYSEDIQDFSDCASTLTSEDIINEGESVCTEIAAGCIFSCSFCDYAALGKKKNQYTRTYDSFEREIIENYKNYKMSFYTLTDNIVNDTTEKIRYMIDVREKTGIDFKWTGYARLDTIQNKEHAILLKESGMVGASFGIESFYKETGAYIGKVTDKTRLLKSLEIMRNVFEDEAIFSGLFIAGLPKEPVDHMIETYEWLNSVDGRYYLDNYAYTALSIVSNNENKNEINKARNNPFRDYVLLSNDSRDWVSPWANGKQILELARKFTVERKNSMGDAFSLSVRVNSGAELSSLIKDIRESGKRNEIYKFKFFDGRKKYLENYKSIILNKFG